MADKPVIWHYGLMAERWAKYINEAPELPYFNSAIMRFGQPVLDVACGTGRLLLPLLREGIDIDGCDISGDMLFHCRNKAELEGFDPNLYEQPMHSFEIPRKYKTIYICGSFGLAGSRDNDLAALQRCYEHLEEGGALLLNIQAEYTSHESWNKWLTENQQVLPEPWPKDGDLRTTADGSENIAYFRFVHLDPLEQSYTREVRIEKWISGEKVAEEVYELRGNVYLKNEVMLMLKVAGFREIVVHGDYSDEIAAAKHVELNFTAVK
jgi:SAM-dependent methyltransferase